jgi:hypothetical protein
MINFRSFVDAINTAISESSDSINRKNEKLFNDYFYEDSVDVIVENSLYNEELFNIIAGVSEILGTQKTISAKLSAYSHKYVDSGLFEKLRSAFTDGKKQDDMQFVAYLMTVQRIQNNISKTLESIDDVKRDIEVVERIIDSKAHLAELIESINSHKKNFFSFSKKIESSITGKVEIGRIANDLYLTAVKLYKEIRKISDDSNKFLSQFGGDTDNSKLYYAVVLHQEWSKTSIDSIGRIVEDIERYSTKRGGALDDLVNGRKPKMIAKLWNDFLKGIPVIAGEKLPELVFDESSYQSAKAGKKDLEASLVVLQTSVEQFKADQKAIHSEISEGDLDTLNHQIRNIKEILFSDEEYHQNDNHKIYMKVVEHTRRYKKKEVKTITPKTVRMNYPATFDYATPNNEKDYKLVTTPIEVPLITLIPLTTYNIEKATLTANFKFVVVENEVQIDFSNTSEGNEQASNVGKLEIAFVPQQSPEGLKALIDSYQTFLKRQIV